MPEPGSLPAWNSRWASFLDVDGTLLDIADHPDAVRTTPRLKPLLRRSADGSVHSCAEPEGHLQHLRRELMEFVEDRQGLLLEDKGSAILQLMQEPPSAGRTPIFAGDDVTDEDGLVAVNGLDGVSIRVGDGRDTAASYRVGSVTELLAWLELNLLGDTPGNKETAHVDA